MWDDEVAVISVGAGPGGLAYAAATADAGLDVLVATPPRGGAAQERDTERGWLPTSSDRLTEDYLSELVTGAIQPAAPAATELPVRTLYIPPRQPSRKAVVDTFVGSRLPVWAGTCLASPFSAVLTVVDHWPTMMRNANGQSVGVASIGAANGGSLADWLADAVREREIAELADARLQRLVFEDARVVGVVFDTPRGEWAVQATHAVALAPPDPAPHASIPEGGDGDVALVGLAGSRFVRVELVHTENAAD